MMGVLDLLKGMNWTRLALGIATVVPQVIDRVQRLRGAAPGPQKADEAVELVATLLQGSEMVAGKNLLDDDEVIAATRALIAANVHLKNVLARKTLEAITGGDPNTLDSVGGI
jgi:hypothetical protein